MMTPIAEIVGGSLRWHIPHDAYAVPVEYLRGSHMLYAATQSEEYDPLLEDLIERLRNTDVAPMNALSLEAADAIEAKDAEIVALRAWKASRLLHEGCNGHMRGDPPTYVPECVSLRADAERYQQLRRGQKWSVINGIGDVLRGDDLDAAMSPPSKEQA